MPVFKATKITPKSADASADDVLYLFCYHFPQYTLAEAKKLPYVRIVGMLKAARKERARYMVDMMRVVSNSTSKKGVKSVLSYFEKLIEE